jgi:hypothetical protein
MTNADHFEKAVDLLDEIEGSAIMSSDPILRAHVASAHATLALHNLFVMMLTGEKPDPAPSPDVEPSEPPNRDWPSETPSETKEDRPGQWRVWVVPAADPASAQPVSPFMTWRKAFERLEQLQHGDTPAGFTYEVR